MMGSLPSRADLRAECDKHVKSWSSNDILRKQRVIIEDSAWAREPSEADVEVLATQRLATAYCEPHLADHCRSLPALEGSSTTDFKSTSVVVQQLMDGIELTVMHIIALVRAMKCG